MEIRGVLSMVILAGCAAGSWAVLTSMEQEDKTAGRQPRFGVGYYASDATLSSTGDDGRFVYKVSAATLRQIPADNSVILHEVSMAYSPEARVPWTLRADTGEIPAGGNIIRLNGNVTAQSLDATGPRATVRTEHLEFDARTDIAATDGEVALDYGGSTVRAVGLRAQLNENQWQLLSSVSGTYVR